MKIKAAKAANRVIVSKRVRMRHMFCPLRTTSIQSKTTYSFVKAQKRNLILIIFYRKIQTLGVKNTTLVIEMVISGTNDTTKQF